QKQLQDVRVARFEREGEIAKSRASMMQSRAEMVGARQGAITARAEARQQTAAKALEARRETLSNQTHSNGAVSAKLPQSPIANHTAQATRASTPRQTAAPPSPIAHVASPNVSAHSAIRSGGLAQSHMASPMAAPHAMNPARASPLTHTL